MTGYQLRKTSLHFTINEERVKRTSTYRTMISVGHICPFPLWLRTWCSWWLPPCWRTSISISSVVSVKRLSHWKRQAGWKPLSCILSVCQRNGCAQEGRTFWTFIPIKHTTLKFSLNKQHFFVAFIFPIGLGGGFYAPARAISSLRSLPITCRGKKTPQHIKSSHKKKCCGIKVIIKRAWHLLCTTPLIKMDLIIP